ncbi:dienelactone hydrolase family protein [Sphingomonas sp. LB-2]|uniref:dienelactone hydrolase family protein n=1 Tax=Sphingomonas caeni TaxID=2984949 RepID=UPI0022328B1D|nr:dienelactone hydrolase family protein [Sphingomonas caeni]MCW3845879.1 dienelactone hydrolase family protein [Sphingomonas caeni]
MCDELTAADNDRFLATTGGISRRAFGAGTAAAGLMALLPRAANAMPVKGRDVTITTPDGVCDAYFVAPARGKHPGVLVWPDIGGLRPAFRQMADRLAESGYAVLTVNPFYRSAKPPYTKEGEAPDAPEIRSRAMEYRKLLTPDATIGDATAFIKFIDAQKETDRKRGIGTTGYCMGGPLVMRTAAAVNGRVRAGGSFHGGGLVTPNPDSPHLLVPQMKGRYLFAVAENDDQRAPQDKETLRAAFVAAKVPAEIEVYAGANHGWCPPDSRVYNQAQAEKAWARLLATFSTL